MQDVCHLKKKARSLRTVQFWCITLDWCGGQSRPAMELTDTDQARRSISPKTTTSRELNERGSRRMKPRSQSQRPKLVGSRACLLVMDGLLPARCWEYDHGSFFKGRSGRNGTGGKISSILCLAEDLDLGSCDGSLQIDNFV